LLGKATAALNSLARSHAAMAKAYADEHVHKKIKLLNNNFKICKTINPIKAAILLHQIKSLTDTLINK
jgi:hypothetical protein